MNILKQILFITLSILPIYGYGAAGLTLYFKSGDEVWLLLADHPNERGWADFAGGTEKGETPQETAAREASEETKGFFKTEDLLKGIIDQEPQSLGNYAFFFLEVPFVSAEALNHFKPSDNSPVYTERGPYAWIPFSEIQKHFDKNLLKEGDDSLTISKEYLPNNAKNTHLWKLWINTLKTAHRNGTLPF